MLYAFLYVNIRSVKNVKMPLKLFCVGNMLEQKVSRFDVDSEMTSVQKARASVVDISG